MIEVSKARGSMVKSSSIIRILEVLEAVPGGLVKAEGVIYLPPQSTSINEAREIVGMLS